jgi:hypothetical protein
MTTPTYAELLAAVEAHDVPLASRLIAAGAPSVEPHNYDIFHIVAMSHRQDLYDYYPRVLLDVFLQHRQGVSEERLTYAFEAALRNDHCPDALRKLWGAGARPSADAIYYCCVNLYDEAADNIRFLIEMGQDFNMRMSCVGEPTLLDWLISAGCTSDCHKGCCEAVFDRQQRRQLVEHIIPLMLSAGGVIENKERWEDLCARVEEEKVVESDSDSESVSSTADSY